MQTRTSIEKSNRAPDKPMPVQKQGLAEFLLQTNFTPLVVIGKCVQQFGWSAVAGFLMGAASVYGYAVFKPLPYSKSEPAPAPAVVAASSPKTVQLRGRVRNGKGSPVNERFWVGVLAKQLGPVQNSDGTFALEVPQSNSYDVALWTSETINIYTGFAAEQDGAGYRLMEALPFLSVADAAPSISARPRSRESPPGAPTQTEIARSEVSNQNLGSRSK